MRNKASNWFETKVRYDKTMEDGQEKKVTEQYVVEALSFTEAEKRMTEEMQPYLNKGSEMEIKTIARTPYNEVLFNEGDKADRYYKIKVDFVTRDERTEKEKRNTFVYLEQANSTEAAQKLFKESMKSSMIDYEIIKIEETKVIDVFEYNN